MLYRIAVAAVCVVVIGACEQAGSGRGALAVTAPSSVEMKAVDVPFSGSVTGGLRFVANPQNCPSGVTIVNESTGTATHMGDIVYYVEQCTNPQTGVMTGKRLILTAANGDEIHGTFTGQTTAAGSVGTQLHVTASFTFSGGTGRFRDATGTAQMTGEVTHTAAFPWPGRWAWTGTIRY